MSNDKIKIGIQLPEAERPVSWTEMMAMATLAEERGFDSIWLGDHLLYRDEDGTPSGPWDVWSLMAAIAAVTNRIEIGPLVACTAFENPAILARKATAIDEISRGRLILGLGAGWNRAEFDAFGIPYDHRASRFEEAFTIIRTLLRTGVVDFHGEWYQANDCVLTPRGPSPAGPPLLIGSIGDRVLTATLPYVDSWNIWYDEFANSVSGFIQVNDRITRICTDVGRDPDEIERTAALLVACSGADGRVLRPTSPPALSGKQGDLNQLADQLKAFQTVGVGHVQLVLDPITSESIDEVSGVLKLI